MKKIFTLSLISLCLHFNATACSCIYFASFCESTTTESNVVEVEVSQKYNSPTDEFSKFMDVSIVEVLNGITSETHLTIVDNGTSCDVNHQQFAIGDHLILRFLNPGTNSEANFPTLSLGGCTEDFLKIDDDTVTGLINPDLTSQSLSDFKDDLMSCTDLTLYDRDIEFLDEDILIFPNPTFEDIDVATGFTILTLDLLSYQLFAAAGQLLSEGEFTRIDSRVKMKNLPNGFYFLKIRYKDQFIVRKVIKR